MLLRSRSTRPPSNRSRSRRVHRSPRKPAYTVAATIAPMIPPHRAAATSTPPPLLAAPARSVPKGSTGQRRPVDLGDLGGHHLPGVAAGGGGRAAPPPRARRRGGGGGAGGGG